MDELAERAPNQSDPLERVEVLQKRLDAQKQLAAPTVDREALEAGFVESAASYGDRKGITHAAWREVGVSVSLQQDQRRHPKNGACLIEATEAGERWPGRLPVIDHQDALRTRFGENQCKVAGIGEHVKPLGQFHF